ncbi:flagellar basal-body rod protein FlgG [Methylogaea oryzae]|uniref:Flagellar basal-body rod protein FlgG n=1 Tax=Methylogaea oryzae TaxID=1295382 RepID=A0A8D4VNB3_9GAMM|nr:flagellar basal-body rod protein FlgG [Methylogaea oryzae]BBL70657.1 flagellar basal-body rod protein FlgG [Methylogaea oryzae]
MTAPALWIAKTGLDAQQTRLSLISQNLANVNTTGYKKERGLFADLMYQNIRQVGAQETQTTTLPSGLQMGTGVRTVATEKIHTQGNIVQTGNSLDLAINGKGFFQVLMPDGQITYTRDGTFKLTADGQVVTNDGNPLEPAFVVPQNAVSISVGSDGTFSVTDDTGAVNNLGQINLAYFINPTGLEPIGNNLFRQTAASGAPNLGIPGQDSIGTISEGALETSNVNAVEELVSMIETQRSYEMNSKAISTSNEMLAFVNNHL